MRAAFRCVAGAVAQTLREFFGSPHIKFTFNSAVTGTTHVYETTGELTKEIADARVYGGMHFRNTMEHGVAMGRMVARYVAENAFEPRRHRPHR